MTSTDRNWFDQLGEDDPMAVGTETPAAKVKELADLDNDERLSRINALVVKLAGSDELERQRYKTALVEAGLIGAQAWNSLLADARKQAEAKRRTGALVTECPYRPIDGCLYLLGEAGEILLAKFVPQVIAVATRDDGSEVTKHVRVRLTTPAGVTAEVDVAAEQLPKARAWSMKALGPAAVITPMSRDEAHVATAAQYLGDGTWDVFTEYTHTGWRNDLGGGWRFLTASGALGATGLDAGITVDLGTDRLNYYALPDPSTATEEEIAEAVRASIDVLDVAPDRVTVPILAAAYRAPLPIPPETSVFVAGPSGSLKTAVSALACQHFGPRLDPKGLPAEWKSTANSIEAIAYQLDGVLMVIDDYAPQAVEDARKLAAGADRIFRGAANASGRNRLRPDGTMRPVKHPRAQILSTGEDVPPGESLRARLTITTVSRGVVDLPHISVAQRKAATGTYALAMAGYIQWLAARRNNEPDLVDKLRAEAVERRAKLTTGVGHARVPEAAAGLILGWHTFIEYARHVKAVTDRESAQLWKRVRAAIVAGMTEQTEHTRQMKVEEIYISALASSLAAGKAHFADRVGLEEPNGQLNPREWGWDPHIGPEMTTAWKSRGDRIGWVDGETGYVYLHPQAAYEVAVAHAKRAQVPLNTSKNGVHKHLHEAGYLHTIGKGEGAAATLTIPVRIGGKLQRVLHVRAELITGEVAEVNGGEAA